MALLNKLKILFDGFLSSLASSFKSIFLIEDNNSLILTSGVSFVFYNDRKGSVSIKDISGEGTSLIAEISRSHFLKLIYFFMNIDSNFSGKISIHDISKNNVIIVSASVSKKFMVRIIFDFHYGSYPMYINTPYNVIKNNIFNICKTLEIDTKNSIMFFEN